MEQAPSVHIRRATTTAPDRPRTRWVRAIRLAWLVYLLLVGALFVTGTPLLMAWSQRPCNGSACTAQLTTEQLRAITQAGFSIPAYVAYLITSGLFTALIGLTLATVVIWHKPTDGIALCFALFFGTCTINATFVPDIIGKLYPALALPMRLFTFSVYGFWPLFAIFPDGRFVPHWARWPALFHIGLGLSDWFFPSLHAPGTFLATFDVFWNIGYGLATVGFQLFRYRRAANALQRQQMKWVFYGIVLILLWAVVSTLLSSSFRSSWAGPAFQATVGMVIGATLILSFWLALFRYRLFDIDLLINHTLVYGALSLIIVGLYVVVVGSLSALFQSNSNLLISLLATALVAVVFQPLRERLQRGVNRLVYGERDDPYVVLSRLGQRLEATLAPEAVLPTIVEMVAVTLKLPYVAIELSTEAGSQMTVEYPLSVDGDPSSVHNLFRLPLTYQAQTLGHLLLAPRAPDETFTPAERHLLEDIARQAGAAAHAVRLTADLQQRTADLQRSRVRLITAREEERRRLRRDLHDGLGPTLAALNLRAGTVRALMTRDPAGADAQIVEMRTQIRGLIADIREVVYGLRPPALDELGLIQAIREQAAQYSSNGLSVSVEAPEQLAPLPAAVEVAAYRIATEALTNVARHAQARRCAVRLTQTDALQIEVTDDGLGLPAHHREGVGITSMRERATELGGTCMIERLSAGGTRVVANFPPPPT
jgi:signal transduction histidine kinase